MSTELKRILCVEDDQDIVDITKMCLETLGGFNVVTCMVPSEALIAIRSLKPDLVLLDVMMPEIDGPAVLAAIQTDPDLYSVPVIFMTARIQPQEIQHYLGLGAIAVIAKPFDPMLLADQVRDAWDMSRKKPRIKSSFAGI